MCLFLFDIGQDNVLLIHRRRATVPLPRWGRLEGKAITANCSANNILQYNYAYQIGIFY